MKILWLMRHAGFVRNYDPLIRLLDSRGHRVHIAYEGDRDKFGETVLADRLAAGCAGVSYGLCPQREDNTWNTLATIARTLLDYLRYLDPRYRNAPLLRQRAEKFLQKGYLTIAGLVAKAGPSAVRALSALLRSIESVLPPSRAIAEFLREQAPDLVVVTPLVDFGSPQVDYIKAARRSGIPSALGVASWDNLTNKGTVKLAPDRIFVWNEVQRSELVEMHGVPADRVVVTGAQIFDHWFGWTPSRTREVFCRDVGLAPDRPILVYVGSSYFLAPHEAAFAVRWLATLRSTPGVLAGTGVLFRPHPNNFDQWGRVDLSGFANACVWPPPGADPFSPNAKKDFFDSLYHSGAVVGVNTSALIEAGIVGRPVCAVLAPEFAHSQEGTLHFRYLLQVAGGVVRAADSMRAHIEDLEAVLAPGHDTATQSRRFVEAFVRPFGLDMAATPLLAEAVEACASLDVKATGPSWWAPAARAVLWLPAIVLRSLWSTRNRPLWAGLLIRPAVAVAVGVLAVAFRLQALVTPAWNRGRRARDRAARRVSRSLRRARHEGSQRVRRFGGLLSKRVRRGLKTVRGFARRGIRGAVNGLLR
ncbi:MAG: hypothetical protein AB1806_18220 [Acidobacteriota bacterium]